MSSQGFTSGPHLPTPENGTGTRSLSYWAQPPRSRYWLHLLLLAFTLLTTTAVGARMMENFRLNRPAFSLSDITPVFRAMVEPSTLAQGLPFSLTLIIILLAHELGHYLACRHYGVSASLPYFLPGPPLIGTFGAFIRIRSPIYKKQELFDIGIAGPLAGFVVLLPALAIGLAFSKVLPGINQQGDFVFGVPVLQWLMEQAIFPGVRSEDIYLHPLARAAWVGIFSTALNLLPIGQLDGGHILYSMAGERHKTLSRVFVLGLVPMGFFSLSWLAWALALLILGLRHPAIFDSSELGAGRKRLGWLALVILVLCFMPTPIGSPAL
ncbi:MAG TPA: site-2 protease family protein [Bryobacteraceae bacterium]|nr:site-2 protease family protein [Bryobacteraceae bacterium]HOL69799.1 site-2 protease family protein [Bryobacteraceae bacterium]HOQ45173.1 site-2 protease family protein [Bryobacteraceae bacterium]HPQ16673.1 site-2 protease family protein [Bryobacteraceae bacterium]HPU71245.1 site-2 protease family protein [Bryobacteraceae bacterium]